MCIINIDSLDMIARTKYVYIKQKKSVKIEVKIEVKTVNIIYDLIFVSSEL